jgi:hypothetical protein
MWAIGGHLGAAVSALVDGQLDEEAAEQAWAHVQHCGPCRRLVEREGWVKRQLASMGGNEPSARLIGSLYDLEPTSELPLPDIAEAWAAVDAIERQGRGRRRAVLVLAGAGSVGAAVFGLTTLAGAPFDGSAGAPAASLTRATSTSTPTPAVVARSVSVHGQLSGWTLRGSNDNVASNAAIGSHR